MIHYSDIQVMLIDDRAGKEFRQHKEGDVGFDIEVWNPNRDMRGYVIKSQSFCDLHSGIRIKVSDNVWGMIRARSSAYFKHGLFIMEATIDSGYTGELFILVYNPNSHDIMIENGARLSQLIVIPKSKTSVIPVDSLPNTERGETGFGSTGR